MRIGTKEDLLSYFSCGMCSDPKGVWTLRITQEGVEDLGHRFLNPEMQWADKLLSAIAEGKVKRIRASSKSIALEKVYHRNAVEMFARFKGAKQSATRGIAGDTPAGMPAAK